MTLVLKDMKARVGRGRKIQFRWSESDLILRLCGSALIGSK